MERDRRAFLKAAGFTALACVAGRKVVEAIEKEGAPPPAAGPKVRWAMVVDPVKCQKKEGCVLCVKACHQAHNVPDVPTPKEEVKWIWKESFQHAFPDQEAAYVDPALTSRDLPVLCNHCDEPPCARVCPTEATWKRADGIVMMDWHRCIGCRYCVAACPYGSRSFNFRDPRPHLAKADLAFPTRTKGVVEKCTFCEERLSRGEPPACVAACPEKAMTFGNVDDPASEVRRLLRERYAIRRKPGLGTGPQVHYLI
jgi:molybdopterin-containing oxidoreductase family iron-sulfur binding subunit